MSNIINLVTLNLKELNALQKIKVVERILAMLQYYVTDATLISDTMTDGLGRINLEELRVFHEILFGFSYLQSDKVKMSDNGDPLLTRLKATVGTEWIAENETYYETKIRDLETKVKSLEDQVTRDAAIITEEQAIASELRRQLADATLSSASASIASPPTLFMPSVSSIRPTSVTKTLPLSIPIYAGKANEDLEEWIFIVTQNFHNSGIMPMKIS
jgi:hypothetical protein